MVSSCRASAALAAPVSNPRSLPASHSRARLAGWVGGRSQEKGLGIGRQSPRLLEVPQLELPAKWQRIGQRRVAGQLSGSECLAQLNDREEVAACLGYDALADQPGEPRTGY